MVLIMMMMIVVEVLGTKVPLFSKVNQNSGSRTFSALLMVMMIPRKNMKRIMATLMKSNAAANDDAIVNQISRSWAPFALFS